MITVHMNIGDFFMGGKPIAEWDEEDISAEKMSILDSLIRDQKTRSISVILNLLDHVHGDAARAKGLQFRKVCDYFKLIIFSTTLYGLYDSATPPSISRMIKIGKKCADQYDGNIYVLSRKDANDLDDDIMNDTDLDIIIYEMDEDRDEVMQRIINRIAYVNQMLYRI